MVNQRDSAREEFEKMVATAQDKVDSALKGLNLDDLMSINYQAGKINNVYVEADRAWNDRTSEENDLPVPTPSLFDDGKIEWHERLVKLADSDGKFDNLIFSTLRATLAKKARSVRGDI